MLTATLFGIFFIPLFYLAVRRWVSRKRPPTPEELAQHHGHERGHEAAHA
jgi:multidrug efflux pump